ncbi:MAG TPA: sulfite exporter TauE/SafE family protein [Capsulimonadaceae bacterium]|nr:sulfite exporter TauE/SafE family protein [Capsulimonadaceae bacterium]
MHLEPWQWVVCALGAIGLGLSKTGIPGLGILAVAVFAIAIPSRESVGVVLPILLVGDIVAVSFYRRHAVWSHLVRLFPAAAVGVVIGWWALGRMSDAAVARVIGVLLIVLVALQMVKMWADAKRSSNAEPKVHPIVAPVMGVFGGFATMVANAAGPIMVLYLLAAGLPKMEFIGTGAWYFLIMNAFKVPFSIRLGLINSTSLPIDALLAPAVIAGAVFGRWVLHHIDQRLFERTAVVLTLIAAVKLLF